MGRLELSLGALLGHLGVSRGRLGVVLAPFWGPKRVPESTFGRARFRALLAWAHQPRPGPPQDPQEHPKTPPRPLETTQNGRHPPPRPPKTTQNESTKRPKTTNTAQRTTTTDNNNTTNNNDDVDDNDYDNDCNNKIANNANQQRRRQQQRQQQQRQERTTTRTTTTTATTTATTTTAAPTTTTTTTTTTATTATTTTTRATTTPATNDTNSDDITKTKAKRLRGRCRPVDGVPPALSYVNKFFGRKSDDSVKFEHSYGDLVILRPSHILCEGPALGGMLRKTCFEKFAEGFVGCWRGKNDEF